MEIKEFRENGYLQEVNRRFFHPLGIALEIAIGENGLEVLNGIWDYRNDAEGIIYDIANSDEERIERFKRNSDFIDSEIESRSEVRIKMFGSIIEPIK